MRITGDSIIKEIVREFSGAAEILNRLGLTCWGCPVASLDTIEMACTIHGLEVETVVRELNERLD